MLTKSLHLRLKSCSDKDLLRFVDVLPDGAAAPGAFPGEDAFGHGRDLADNCSPPGRPEVIPMRFRNAPRKGGIDGREHPSGRFAVS